MKSVGIKVLKDKLSTYLKFVRQGEVVLVTDRDEVIAEIRKPSSIRDGGGSKLDAFLKEGSARGELQLASADSFFPKAKSDLPRSPISIDIGKLLEEAREERS